MDLESTLLTVLARPGKDRGADVSAWAVMALEAGLDSPALLDLAGLDRDTGSAEVDALLHRCAAELGFTVPGHARCVAAYARSIAADIVAGTLAPRAGAGLLYQLHLAEDLPALAPWSRLDYAIDLARDGVIGTLDEVDREIVEEAGRLLE